MARLASVIEDRPPPPADDPELAQMLPPSPDVAVLALDHDGHPVGAAWWHFPDCPLVVTPDGAPVPELVVAVTPDDRGRGVGRSLLDALTTALPSAATTGWPSTSTSATPPPGSTAAPASWSRGRDADRSASPWSGSYPREPKDREQGPCARLALAPWRRGSAHEPPSTSPCATNHSFRRSRRAGRGRSLRPRPRLDDTTRTRWHVVRQESAAWSKSGRGWG